MTADRIDAYVSFADADSDRALALAAELRAAGLRVHLAAPEPGEHAALVSDAALQQTHAAIVVVGVAGVVDATSGAPTPDYAAIMALHASGRIRVIPVVLDTGVRLPPNLGALEPVSFARADSARAHDDAVQRLVAAVREEPLPDQGSAVPDYDRSAGGPIRATLRLDASTTTLLSSRSAPVAAPHGTTAARVNHLCWAAGDRHDVEVLPDPIIRDTGEILGKALLPGPIGPALTRLVASADRENEALELGIEAAPEAAGFADLPWERLHVPGMDDPLVLHRVARVHRHIGGLGQTPAATIPGPLRILAVIAAPDDAGLRVLDHEDELATILRQVDEAHRRDAYVRILNWGSLADIRIALAAERFHVLHISCHARPGHLALETPDGKLDQVDADTFVRNVVLPGQDVPLVVLAGCSTALSPGGADRFGSDDATALTGLARGLLKHGVPAVLAMTRPVGDRYATTLLARVYRELSDRPDPLAVLSDVRRVLEDDEPGSGEWATAALFSRVRHPVLFDPAAPRFEVARPLAPSVGDGIIDLDPGDFVGRRTDLRRLMKKLRDVRHSGVLIHGAGGIGKSSLAVQLVTQLGIERQGVVMLHGRRTVDDLLDRIAAHVRRWASGPRKTEIRETAADLKDRSTPWDERLETLADLVLPTMELVLLLDDPIGDPLEEDAGRGADPEAVLDPDVFAFVDAWLGVRGARLILTVRNRALDPTKTLRNDHRLIRHHLGPLSEAEVDKLLWRLPAIWRLEPHDRRRAHRDLGGHPRVLEYLDALLRGHEDATDAGDTVRARRTFRTVTERLHQANVARGLAPTGLVRPRAGQLGAAVWEATAAASAEVLLEQLRARLVAADPVAAQLFTGASVYRQPVDEDGLNWMISGDRPGDAQRSARLRAVHDALAHARLHEPHIRLETLHLPSADRAQLNRDFFALAAPERRADLPSAQDRLVDLTLLTRVNAASTGQLRETRYLVHRWTARRLAELVGEDVVRASHRRAAAYLRWHAERYRDEALQDLEEARYHYWMAGERDLAVSVAQELCAALHSSGSYPLVVQVCADTLDRLGPDEPRRRIFLHFLAVVALARGDLDAAETYRRTCLRLAEEANDQAGVAASLQQLGVIAQFRGDAAAAEGNYRAVVQASSDRDTGEQAVVRAVLASSYQQLCALRIEAGDTDAWRFNAGASDIIDGLAYEADLARGLADLERLALAAGDVRLAAEHATHTQEARSLRLDVQRMRAASRMLFAAVSLLQNDPESALHYLEGAVRIADGPLAAKCLHLAADARYELGDYSDAALNYQLFEQLSVEIGDVFGAILAGQQLGRIATELGDHEEAAIWLDRARIRAEELGNTNLLGWTLCYLGTASAARGDDGAADRQLGEAMAVADRVGNDALWCAAGLELAAGSARRGDTVTATELFGAVLDRARRLNNRRAMVACCVARGMLAQHDERFPEAAHWFDTGYEYALAGGDHGAAAGCLLHAGRLASQQGRHADAEDIYRECLGLLKPPAFPELRLAATVELGRSRAAQNDASDAAQILSSVSADDEDYETSEARLRRLVLLSRAYASNDDEAAAEAVARRCADASTEVDPSPLTSVALLAAGEACVAQDEISAARGHFAAALSAAESVGGAGATLVADCSWWLAAVARADGDQVAAAAHLDRALALALDCDDRIAAMHVLLERGRVARDAGESGQAREYFVRSAAAAGRLGRLYSRAQAACLLLIADLDQREGRRDEAAALRTHARAVAGVPEPRLPVRVDNDALVTTTARGWYDLLWQRRLIAVEGELAFGGSMESLFGPSLDETLRDLSPRRSALSTLASVVLMVGRPDDPVRRAG